MFELRSVDAGYGPTDVLRDVTVVVPPASVVAVLGPNGAGKTTLLRVASRLLRPRAGAILLDGEDVTSWPADRLARRGVCHVPEGRGVFRGLTVEENLRLQVHGPEAAEAIDRAVQAFPVLGKRLSQVAGTLSGGQQQMLALARAYASNPRVMLLDEVSMGLAPIVVDEIFAFLASTAKQGVALLLVEQYVTRALALADFAFLLDRGRIVFAGEAGELDADSVYSRYLAATDA